MQFRIFPALCALALPAFCAGVGGKVDFARDIQPIFEQRCEGCHGPKQHLAGLRFDDRESARRVILPGHAADSRLIQMVKGATGKVMPPVGAKLSGVQIATLTRWIDQGADWPSNATIAPHWAWQPVGHPSGTIDSFILARLAKENITPSPEADRATLLRRLSLDLTGLPPTPQETAEFLEDQRPDAWARQVDRLLASPHYGEKWARYWLDLAHYADSDGFEKDLERAWSWRYRDWVIDAYNRDLPYDRFVTLQLAGDEIPGATVEDRIATGFYRNTLTNRESGVDPREARFDQLVDRVGTTATVFLGLTLRCAQCHDHKFDPLKQRDFYRMLAYFNGADEANIEAPLPGEPGLYLRARPEYDRKRTALLAEYDIPELQEQWEQDMVSAMDDPGKHTDWDFQVTEMRSGFDHADRVLHTPPAERSELDRRRLTARFIATPGPRVAADKALMAKLNELDTKLSALNKSFPALSMAYVMEDRADYGPAHIALRGDYKNPGAEVQPGVPEFLPGSDKPLPTRLDLARWIVAPENPLTARVAVNRIWQELFGRGLVSTSDDFGTQGDKPSHPELLDWLAGEYRNLGWSNKALIREIVLSSSYRRSSNARPDLEQKDPANALLARQSRLRLPAELIRDQALAVSGLLDTDVGGPSIKPFQPAGVAELGFGRKYNLWTESPGREKYRRGLYIHYQRSTPYPFLVNFDEPDSTLACTRRGVSNTALQALDLLNDPVFFEAAQALAHRIETEARGDFKARLDFAYRITLNRDPTDKETVRLAQLYEAQSWEGVSRIILNLDEFITRE
ncbi:MAG: PSD1 and planctomycete cytochrome C domain-containing protein [Bryobacteraceae bacterium]|jgi:hypothetical protein